MFWDRIVSSGLLNIENLILAGDLNLNIHSFENWGRVLPSYPLEDYFLDIFDKAQLVDLAPSKITPTWRSKKVGVNVGKRLDRFLIKESLVDMSSSYKS